jgi:hypothetical protein
MILIGHGVFVQKEGQKLYLLPESIVLEELEITFKTK